MQVKWGLRLFIKDLLIIVFAFLVAYHFYINLVNDPYVQRIFFN